MANIKQSKKRVRQTKGRTARNRVYSEALKQAQKNVETLAKEKAPKNKLQEAFSLLQKKADKAVKTNVIHQRRADRIKARLSKLIAQN